MLRVNSGGLAAGVIKNGKIGESAGIGLRGLMGLIFLITH